MNQVASEPMGSLHRTNSDRCSTRGNGPSQPVQIYDPLMIPGLSQRSSKLDSSPASLRNSSGSTMFPPPHHTDSSLPPLIGPGIAPQMPPGLIFSSPLYTPPQAPTRSPNRRSLEVGPGASRTMYRKSLENRVGPGEVRITVDAQYALAAQTQPANMAPSGAQMPSLQGRTSRSSGVQQIGTHLDFRQVGAQGGAASLSNPSSKALSGGASGFLQLQMAQMTLNHANSGGNLASLAGRDVYYPPAANLGALNASANSNPGSTGSSARNSPLLNRRTVVGARASTDMGRGSIDLGRGSIDLSNCPPDYTRAARGSVDMTGRRRSLGLTSNALVFPLSMEASLQALEGEPTNNPPPRKSASEPVILKSTGPASVSPRASNEQKPKITIWNRFCRLFARSKSKEEYQLKRTLTFS